MTPQRTITFNQLKEERDKEEETKKTVDDALKQHYIKDIIAGKVLHAKKDWQRWSIKSIASLISFTASYMSMYYTFSWFIGRLPFVQAIFMTIIIVGSILVAPQMIRLVLLNKVSASSLAASLALSIILSISAMFSMMTTIGTLYNAQSSMTVESSENTDKREAIESILAARREKRERLTKVSESLRNDEERYKNGISILLAEGNTGGREMSTLVANRNKAQKAREEAEKEITALISQEETSSLQASNIRSDRPDFITWIAKRLDIDRNWSELLMNAIPAIFVDVLAPSMLMVALFL